MLTGLSVSYASARLGSAARWFHRCQVSHSPSTVKAVEAHHVWPSASSSNFHTTLYSICLISIEDASQGKGRPSVSQCSRRCARSTSGPPPHHERNSPRTNRGAQQQLSGRPRAHGMSYTHVPPCRDRPRHLQRRKRSHRDLG